MGLTYYSYEAKKWVSSTYIKEKFVLLGFYDTLDDAKKKTISIDRFLLSNPNVTRTRYYIFNVNSKIYLPAWYSLDERKKLVRDFTEYRNDLFDYNLPISKNDKTPAIVQYRLGVFASYLIENVLKPKNNDIITNYKSNKIKQNENILSQYSDDYVYTISKNVVR